jgi:hypothetical protein
VVELEKAVARKSKRKKRGTRPKHPGRAEFDKTAKGG